ncbi:MAG: hypothetical protein D6795_01105 [Deltaproteobacteria bacterium]|nr:MAG: hypothetical protein D6795_01105 [Deltaproteobacteria bacterium]
MEPPKPSPSQVSFPMRRGGFTRAAECGASLPPLPSTGEVRADRPLSAGEATANRHDIELTIPGDSRPDDGLSGS